MKIIARIPSPYGPKQINLRNTKTSKQKPTEGRADGTEGNVARAPAPGSVAALAVHGGLQHQQQLLLDHLHHPG